ncbi:MAG: hypothetical protein QOF71_2961 [Candidatus Eremiobacteraeota bacterium]|jgi:hypothetical protein|nr:hypothetical protein [Candidatus Eremiobacteraeota bacterium]
MKPRFTPLLAAAALALAPAFATAQTTPAPMTAPTPPPPNTMPSTPAPVSEPTAAATSAPAAPASTPAPKATMSTNPSGGTAPTNNGKHLGQIKQIPNGAMSTTDLRYALTHPLQEANKVRQMKKISFDKLRVYRLSSGLKSMLKIGDANADIPVLAVLGPGTLIAQTSGLPGTNGSNSPIAYLQYVLANINVSNALNNVNVLNNSTVNVGVSLQDVLNGNKISIGQVAGIFVNGLGIITTITK